MRERTNFVFFRGKLETKDADADGRETRNPLELRQTLHRILRCSNSTRKITFTNSLAHVIRCISTQLRLRFYISHHDHPYVASRYMFEVGILRILILLLANLPGRKF